MVATTVNQGYYYPLSTDQADLPVQLYSFAAAVDSDLSVWDAAFTGVTKSKCFRYRLSGDITVAASGGTSFGFTVADIDKTTGWTFASNGFISTLADAGWWFFGVTLVTQVGTGTPTVSTSNRYYFEYTYPDPVTSRNTDFSRSADDIEENGAPGGYANLNTLGYLPGVVVGNHSFINTDSASSRVIKADSSFYGIRLGS